MNDNEEIKIKCPKCGGNCRTVKDSRPHVAYGEVTIKRRRVCDTCGERVTTFEILEHSLEKMRREIAKDMVVNLLAKMTA